MRMFGASLNTLACWRTASAVASISTPGKSQALHDRFRHLGADAIMPVGKRMRPLSSTDEVSGFPDVVKEHAEDQQRQRFFRQQVAA